MIRKEQIPSDTYSKDYLLSRHTEGYKEFKTGSLSLLKRRELEMLDLREAITVLELGYGRGELLYHMALSGAKVTGIDYSEAAFEIAKETLQKFHDTADIRIADCRNLPFPDNSFERVFAGDVIEHLSVIDACKMLREVKRVLKPGGFFLLHTAPNSVFIKFIYPLFAKPILKMFNKTAINTFEEHLAVSTKVHIFEYNLLSLKRVLRKAGMYKARVWIDPDILRSSDSEYTRDLEGGFIGTCAARLGNFFPFRFLLGNDIYAKYIKE